MTDVVSILLFISEESLIDRLFLIDVGMILHLVCVSFWFVNI